MSEQGSLFTMADAPMRWPVEDKRLVKPDQLTLLASWLLEAPELFVDYETTGLDARKGHKPFCVGLFSPNAGAKVVDFRYLGEPGLRAVRDGLGKRPATKRTIAFNCQFETGMSRALGFELGGKLWDPMMAAFAVNELRPDYGEFGAFSQKALCWHELHVDPVQAKAVNAWRSNNGNPSYDHVPAELMVPYQCEDVELGWKLHSALLKQVQGNYQMDLVQTDSDLGRVVSDLEARGVQLDVAKAKGLIDRFQAERKHFTKEAFTALGRPFDLGSDTALFGILYGELGFPMHADLEKKGKLDKPVLQWMMSLPQCDDRKRHLIQAVLEVRELDVLIDTFLLPWVYQWSKDGILYPNLNMRGARTRRFSAQDPNMQNVPTRTERGAMVRECIVSRDGWSTYSLDLSQAEYRAFTHYSRDPVLTNGYKTQRDFDIHAQVAAMLGVKRKDGKNLNFGLLYGMGKDKLARSLLRSKADAEQLLNAYYARIPGIKRLKGELEGQVRRFGYIKDVFGGRRHLSVNDAYKALNSLCQMTVGNMIRRAMVRSYPIIKRAGGYLLLQIHDELAPEFPGDGGHEQVLDQIREQAMEAFPEFSVPTVADVQRWTPSWQESKNAA